MDGVIVEVTREEIEVEVELTPEEVAAGASPTRMRTTFEVLLYYDISDRPIRAGGKNVELTPLNEDAPILGPAVKYNLLTPEQQAAVKMGLAFVVPRSVVQQEGETDADVIQRARRKAAGDGLRVYEREKKRWAHAGTQYPMTVGG